MQVSFASFGRFIWDELLVVSVPQRIIIPNQRLAILLRFSQLFVCVMALGFTFFSNTYTHFEPRAGNLELWKQASPMPDEILKRTARPSYCVNSQPYWFNYSGAGVHSHWDLHPTGCESARPTIWDATNFVFLLTMHQDWGVCMGNCRWAKAFFGAPPTGDNSSESCSCTDRHSYFFKDPEYELLKLRHGYQVEVAWESKLDMRVGERISGSIMQDGITRVRNGKTWEEPGSLLTIIHGINGTQCNISGRAVWPKEVVKDGIGGTFKEWLACAGVDLDDDPGTMAKNVRGLAPRFRTMGVRLELIISYYNYAPPDAQDNDIPQEFPDILCIVKVVPTPQWSYVVTGDQTFYGVEVRATVTGSYRVFDISKLIATTVHFIVLLQIPRTLVQLIALYGLGFMSKLYRRAWSRKFRPQHTFQNTLSKVLHAEMSFRGMVGGDWTSDSTSLGGISCNELKRRLQHIFQDELSSGTLDHDHLHCIASIAFEKLHDDNTGTINCDNFVKAVTAEEIIDLRSMVKLISRPSRSSAKWVPFAFLDLTRRQLGSAVARWNRALIATAPDSRARIDVAKLRSTQQVVADRIEVLESMDIEQRLAALEAAGQSKEGLAKESHIQETAVEAIVQRKMDEMVPSWARTAEQLHNLCLGTLEPLDVMVEAIRERVERLELQVAELETAPLQRAEATALTLNTEPSEMTGQNAIGEVCLGQSNKSEAEDAAKAVAFPSEHKDLRREKAHIEISPAVFSENQRRKHGLQTSYRRQRAQTWHDAEVKPEYPAVLQKADGLWDRRRSTSTSSRWATSPASQSPGRDPSILTQEPSDSRQLEKPLCVQTSDGQLWRHGHCSTML